MYQVDNLPTTKDVDEIHIDEAAQALFNLDTSSCATMKESMDTLLKALVHGTGHQRNFDKMRIAICSTSAQLNAGRYTIWTKKMTDHSMFRLKTECEGDEHLEADRLAQLMASRYFDPASEWPKPGQIPELGFFGGTNQDV
ncbi:hypothetical protein DFH06DRAFT_1120548 [Mycena polygramma]|nr:hypothetical protein DFH06DRAFT_1120548 [Mycena polygramma]